MKYFLKIALEINNRPGYYSRQYDVRIIDSDSFMAHEPTPEYSFFSFWVDWLKGKTSYSRHELTFSEGLLITLYCETDVGSIPRGAQPESYSTPKYKNNPNWNKHIIGCYWCGRERTTVNGICCCKECIYYFHEWCVERVELFQGKRFCKLPGCDLSPTDANHVCCNRSHNKEYEEMFEFINKRKLCNLLIKGPSWYNCEYSFDKTPPVLTHNTPSKLIAQKAVRDLAKQIKSNLIHYTDVGPIPRSYKTAEHSASHFSKHDNWLTDIRGCYLCGMSVTDGSEYLCSNRCYLVFNDWCRRKVLKESGIKYCELPGCEKVIEHQDSSCSLYHLNRRDEYLGSDEYYKLLQKGPHWYNNTPSDTSSTNTGKSTKHSTPDTTGLNTHNTINIPQHSQHENKKPATNPSHTPTQLQHSQYESKKPATNPSHTPTQLQHSQHESKKPATNPSHTPTQLQHSQYESKKPATNPSHNPTQLQHSQHESKKPATNPFHTPTQLQHSQYESKKPAMNPSHTPTQLQHSQYESKKPATNPSHTPTQLQHSQYESKKPATNPSHTPTQLQHSQYESKKPATNPSHTPTQLQHSQYESKKPATNPSHTPTQLQHSQYESKKPATNPSHTPTQLQHSQHESKKPATNPSHTPTQLQHSQYESKKPATNPSHTPTQLQHSQYESKKPATNPSHTPTQLQHSQYESKKPATNPSHTPTQLQHSQYESKKPATYPSHTPTQLQHSQHESKKPATNPSHTPTQLQHSQYESKKPATYPSHTPTQLQHSQHESKKPAANPSHTPTQSQHSAFVNPFKRHLVFSETLTDWLYKDSDIGPIPRSLIRFPEVSVMNKLTKSNWNTYIPMCYWCCGDDVTNTKGIACSEKCFFLFSEWCHERYYNSKFKRICKICGCLPFFGRDTCFTHSTEYSFYSKYTHLLKTSDYALGPQWYSDTKLRHIDFYNREDPFYEFTNFYPCTRLNLDAKEWKTTEHYFQAQKFVGTPHVEYVGKLDSPRSAFEYTRRPEVQKWVRPDWAKVKEEVMLKAVQEKFNQSQELGQLLVRTGDVKLFKHTRNDKFWGDGGDRRGENKLGMILMQVRFDLHAKCPFFPSRLCRIQESGSNSVSNPDQNEAPPQKASFEDSKESGIQTLLTFGVNNEDTNLVQNGGTNTNQQNLSLFPPTHPPQTNTSSSSLQPSALPFEYSNANSERISNSNKPPCYPSTNPFANLIHEGSSKITDIVSEPLSTKTEEISGITPGQKLGYSMKHDLPEDYNGPFDLIHLGSVEMGTGQNENSPQVVSLEDSKEEKSIENSSTNVVTTLSDKPVIDMCDETGYGSFADISSSTPGQKLEYSAKHDLPEDYHSPFGPNNLDSVEMETGESENPPQVVSSSDRQHNTDSDPIQSEHTSIVGEDDSSMETSQIEDSRDKDNPEPSNTRLITESKSDSNGLPRTEPHQRYDESNRFAKHLDDKSHVSASDTESS